MAGRQKSPPPPPEKNRALIAQALLDLVSEIHRTKNIPKDVVFNAIESAVQLAAERAMNSEDIVVHLDRSTGELTAMRGTEQLDPEKLGRIAAQSAKQLIIQKNREAEGDSLFNEYMRLRGKLVTGTIQRLESGTAIVSLSSKAEALLPRSEQIPGESHHVNDRVKAIVMEVKRQGHRVKIVLSRCHADFVRSLFEEAIPEVEERIIDIRAVAREAGYRSKVAVSSIDMKVDCVGACVGVRGSRIKTITEELNGERIDIVRWNDSLQVLIPNALSPATIEEVFTYPRLGRAIVLVNEDQLSLAIGRRGQNVRLASKLVGWDLEIMTHDELDNSLQKAERWFRAIPQLNDDMLNALIEEGFLSYTDLTFMEAAQISEITGLSEEDADDVIAFAEEMSEQFEKFGEPEEEAAPNEASAEGEGEAATASETEEADAAEATVDVDSDAAPEAEVETSIEDTPAELNEADGMTTTEDAEAEVTMEAAEASIGSEAEATDSSEPAEEPPSAAN